MTDFLDVKLFTDVQDGFARIKLPTGALPRIGEEVVYLGAFYTVTRVIWDIAGAGATGGVVISLYGEYQS